MVWKGRAVLKPVNQSKNLFHGALILTISGLITKILSAFYRIPFQNIVGDVGFYIYQQIYPFYGAAIVLATTGFPVVISKLYAECIEKDDLEGARRFLLISFIFLQLIGLLCFIILFAGARPIAIMMKDPNLAVLIKVVSLVFLLFPITSLVRGYYQGTGNMIPTAYSQVGEQSVRVLTIIIISSVFMRKGFSLYLVGGGAMFGSVTGSLVSSFILFTFLWIRKEWKVLGLKLASFRGVIRGSGWIYKALIFQGLTICISGMLMIVIQMADAMNLFSLLVTSGVDNEAAKSLKGVFDRGQPLIQMGTVSATSMSLSLVPLIASERLKKQGDFLFDKIKLSMQISFIIGLGACAGLWAIIEPTNIMLFENHLGSSVLGVLSLVILFNSIISTITAILQGLGNLLFPAVMIMIAFPIKYGLNLMLIPYYGTMGAAFSSVVTLAFISLLLGMKLKEITIRPFFTVRFFGAVLTAAFLMVLFLKCFLAATNGLYEFFFLRRLAASFQAVLAVLLGGSIYLWIIMRSKIFSEEDLTYLPFGSKLAWFLKQNDRSRC